MSNEIENDSSKITSKTENSKHEAAKEDKESVLSGELVFAQDAEKEGKELMCG